MAAQDALTDSEKERVRYHLGYIETGGSAASLQLGIPRPVQTAFLLESSINLLNDQYAVSRVRCILDTLDMVEQKMRCALDQLSVSEIGEMKLRGAEPGRTVTDLLEREYGRWARRLADVLGVPLYAYSERFRGSGTIANVRVS